jgi:hypothetical protein
VVKGEGVGGGGEAGRGGGGGAINLSSRPSSAHTTAPNSNHTNNTDIESPEVRML